MQKVHGHLSENWKKKNESFQFKAEKAKIDSSKSSS
jgi:hypothetical protein